MKLLDFNITFLTDKLVENKVFSIKNRDAEGNDKISAYNIKESIESITKSVHMFDNIATFTSKIDQLKNTIVFSTLYGEALNSSKSLVPAICEANNIRYVGADSYTHMLCNDKYLSKLYVKEFGLCSPNGVLIRNVDDQQQLQSIKYLKTPLVIKPNYGGGSNGILESNLKNSYEEAIELVKTLYQYQKQPILVEEYIAGQEVEVILFGNHSKVLLCDETQIVIDGMDYFDHQIWGLERKKIDDNNIQFKHCHFIKDDTRNKMKSLFLSFEKVEFMRIDCRINNGKVFIIELSPDCYMGNDGGFYFAFESYGFTYPEMLYLMILNAITPESISICPLIEKFNNNH